ncbi:unnamed protein product [Pedinophyceae sp. YPF-701]|nr:unnamed protein product [Pedinophyceae sp. YPF-701]
MLPVTSLAAQRAAAPRASDARLRLSRQSVPCWPCSAAPRRAQRPPAPQAAAGDAHMPHRGHASSFSTRGAPSSNVAERAKAFLATILDPVPGDAKASRFVGALCGVQFLWTLSGIMVQSYLPVYLKETLQLSNTKIGDLEALSLLMQKVCNFSSGIVGDMVGHKGIMLFGAALYALGRPMFAVTGSVYTAVGAVGVVYWLTAARVLDRVTKGFRDTPIKALIVQRAGSNAAVALASKAAYQNLALALGGTFAGILFQLTGQSFVTNFTLAVVPAIAALVLCYTVPDPAAEALASNDEAPAPTAASTPQTKPAAAAATRGGMLEKAKKMFALATSGALQPAYWQAVAVFAVLFIARFEASFVSIRMVSVGTPKALLPMIASAALLAQFFIGKLMGAWVDIKGQFSRPEGFTVEEHMRRRNTSFVAGFAALVAANAAFVFLGSVPGMVVGYFLIALHMGMTHALIGATLQSYVPKELKGTAFSLFDITAAGSLFLGNMMAGRTATFTENLGWGPVGCFLMGGGATTVALAMLIVFLKFGDLGKADRIVALKAKA